MHITYLRVLRVALRYCSRFQSSAMVCYVVGCVVSDVSTDLSACISYLLCFYPHFLCFSVEQYKTDCLTMKTKALRSAETSGNSDLKKQHDSQKACICYVTVFITTTATRWLRKIDWQKWKKVVISMLQTHCNDLHVYRRTMVARRSFSNPESNHVTRDRSPCQTCTRSSSINSRLFQATQNGKRSIWGRQCNCMSNSACRYAALGMNWNLTLWPMFLLSLYQTRGGKWRTGSRTDNRNNNEWREGRNKDTKKQNVEKFNEKRRNLYI
jgi:hypothetical protein